MRVTSRAVLELKAEKEAKIRMKSVEEHATEMIARQKNVMLAAVPLTVFGVTGRIGVIVMLSVGSEPKVGLDPSFLTNTAVVNVTATIQKHVNVMQAVAQWTASGPIGEIGLTAMYLVAWEQNLDQDLS
jgi:hypothetical protein